MLEADKRFSEEIWKGIIAEVDINNDGEVSYEEFKAMMNRLITC